MTIKRAHCLGTELVFDARNIAKALRIAPERHAVCTLRLPILTTPLVDQSG
jgi:hypothetical protein